MSYREISAQELNRWLDDGSRPRPVLLDVREPWEFERARIDGSVHIPMREIPARLADLDPDQSTVVVCHHGGRSAQVGYFLARSGFRDIINLRGGVDAWSRDVDPKVPLY